MGNKGDQVTLSIAPAGLSVSKTAKKLRFFGITISNFDREWSKKEEISSEQFSSCKYFVHAKSQGKWPEC